MHRLTSADATSLTRQILGRAKLPLSPNLRSSKAFRLTLLCGFLLACCALTCAFAQNTVAVGSSPGYPNVTVQVPVVLRNADEVVAAQFDVAYNSTKVSADLGRGLISRTSNHVVRVRQISPGVQRVLIYSLTNSAIVRSNGGLVQIPFTLAANEFVGSGPIVPTNAFALHGDGTSVVPLDLLPGSVFARLINRRPDGIVDYFLPTIVDETYLIQASTNLVDWVNISTNLALSSFTQLVDADGASHPYRFYRSALFNEANRGQLSGGTILPDGSVDLRLTGLNEKTYTVEASTNLVNWSPIGNATVVNSRIRFSDPAAGQYKQRFYRLKSN